MAGPDDKKDAVKTPGTSSGPTVPYGTPEPSGDSTIDFPDPSLQPLTERYDLLRELGSGGMGVVYKARDRETDEVVALKVVKPEVSSRPDLIERFKAELKLARKITHKNVCRTHELLRFGDTVVIAMEYVEGESLRAILKSPGGVSLRRGLEWVGQICSALAEAHVQGVIHRDLKPENILITRDGIVKVMDFGIARSLEPDSTQTGSGIIIGTPAYMSPEQVEGKPADARSDIYSLGLVMYEMFTGQPAFRGDTPISLALKQLNETPSPLCSVEPDLPEQIDHIVQKCLRKRPEERYQSTLDLALDLENLRRDSSEVRAATPSVDDQVPEDEEEGLLRRVLPWAAPKPRRWWELNHLFGFAFYLVFIYVAWRVYPWAGEVWGRWFFIAALLLGTTTATLRLYLLVTSVFIPRGLATEVRRLAVPLRGSTALFWLLILAFSLAHLDAQTGAAALLATLALGGGIAGLLAEPAIDRAAFPRLTSEKLPAPPLEVREQVLRRNFHWLAALQTLYAAGFVFAIVILGEIMEVVGGFSELHREGNESAATVTLGVLLGGLVISAWTAVALWRRELESVRAIRRWFPLYLPLDVTAGLFLTLPLIVPYAEVVGALLTLPIVVYVPFYQRRLAKQILEQLGPSEAAPAAGPLHGTAGRAKALLADTTSLHLALVGLLQLLYHVGVLVAVFYSRAGLIEDPGAGTATLVVFLGAGVSASLAIELWRCKPEGTRFLLRWFAFFPFLDAAAAALAFTLAWDKVREVPPPVILLILVVVFVARFYQRRLAQSLRDTGLGAERAPL